MTLRTRLYFGCFFVVIIASLFGPTLATAQRVAAALNDPAVVRRYQQFITADGLASRLYFLASDFFEGRETATRGQKMAAHYLSRLEVAINGKQVASSTFSTDSHDDLSFFYTCAASGVTGGVVFGGFGVAGGAGVARCAATRQLVAC